MLKFPTLHYRDVCDFDEEGDVLKVQMCGTQVTFSVLVATDGYREEYTVGVDKDNAVDLALNILKHCG